MCFARWTRGPSGKLALTLLKTRVLLVDDIQLPLPSHDLTIGAAFFDRCTYFHDELIYLFIGVMESAGADFIDNCYYLYLNIILPRVRS